jgi:hypothetical protein
MAAKRFEVWTLANPNKMPNPEELAAIYGGVS